MVTIESIIYITYVRFIIFKTLFNVPTRIRESIGNASRLVSFFVITG